MSLEHFESSESRQPEPQPPAPRTDDLTRRFNPQADQDMAAIMQDIHGASFDERMGVRVPQYRNPAAFDRMIGVYTNPQFRDEITRDFERRSQQRRERQDRANDEQQLRAIERRIDASDRTPVAPAQAVGNEYMERTFGPNWRNVSQREVHAPRNEQERVMFAMAANLGYGMGRAHGEMLGNFLARLSPSETREWSGRLREAGFVELANVLDVSALAKELDEELRRDPPIAITFPVDLATDEDRAGEMLRAARELREQASEIQRVRRTVENSAAYTLRQHVAVIKENAATKEMTSTDLCSAGARLLEEAKRASRRGDDTE